MRIHTNAPVAETIYMEDAEGNPLAIVAGVYKCELKAEVEDAEPVLTFVTGGGIGVGDIVRSTATIEGVVRDILVFVADQDLVAALVPGAYMGDLLRTDDPAFVFDFEAEVIAGITAP